MKTFQKYKDRAIRFLEIYSYNDWKIKLYSISIKNETVSDSHIRSVKENLDLWLKQSSAYSFENYKIGTLIIHEGREGCFVVFYWWLGENMIQNVVYFKEYDAVNFQCISKNGLMMCVWEMEILQHDRSAWIKHILLKNENPDFNAYLNEQLTMTI